MLSRHRICTSTEEFSNARIVTFLNPYSLLKIIEADTDLTRFDKICIDGVALKIFLQLIYRNFQLERLSFDFTSVANLVFENAAANKERGFILGADEKSNAAFLTKISTMFSGITLQGRSGYFDDEQALSDYLNTLATTDHDFIVVGMGAVKQEQAVNVLVDSGFKGRVYTCGGFIHQTAMSGSGQYYPAWVDRFNLRFAYRMFKEPSTVRRYLIDYPRAFVLFTLNIKKFKN